MVYKCVYVSVCVHLCVSEWDSFSTLFHHYFTPFCCAFFNLRLQCKEISRVYSLSLPPSIEINNGNSTVTSMTMTAAMTKAVNNIVFLFIHLNTKTQQKKREWMAGMARGCLLPMREHKIQYKISTEIESGFFLHSFLSFTPFFCIRGGCCCCRTFGSNKWSVRAWFSITSHQIAFLSPLVYCVTLTWMRRCS